MPAEKILYDDSLCRLDLLVGDPVSAHVVRSERLDGQPVCIKAAGLHPLQPISLDDMDAVRVALAEEPFTQVRCRPFSWTRSCPRPPVRELQTHDTRMPGRSVFGISRSCGHVGAGHNAEVYSSLGSQYRGIAREPVRSQPLFLSWSASDGM